MQIHRTETRTIRSESQVVEVRQCVRSLALALKFSLTDQTKLVTAASEIARNTLIYGKGGDVVIESVEDKGRVGIRMIFTDQGPGIKDIDQALSDGFTSGSGLGLGLGGSKRLVHEFDVRSPTEGGLIVSLLRWK
ncbi:MAG: anti-sigma regulatory factor [Proteobacteria bacterium]|nr:MAG: anti-sigma regulatory factor [Pseudomonadota bacterium]